MQHSVRHSERERPGTARDERAARERDLETGETERERERDGEREGGRERDVGLELFYW